MNRAINIMNENVISMDINKGFKGALDIMLKTKADYIIITQKNKAVGIITERDILKAIASKIKNISTIKLTKVMTDDLISVDLNTDISEVTNVMQEEDIRHLPVMENKRVMGIIKASDVFKKTKEIQTKNIKFSRYQNIQSVIILIFFIFLLVYIFYKISMFY